MGYNLNNIGDKQLEPPVMPKVDMDRFCCCCHPTCTQLVEESQLVECTEDCGPNGEQEGTGWECGKYVWTEHMQEHIRECHQ